MDEPDKKPSRKGPLFLALVLSIGAAIGYNCHGTPKKVAPVPKPVLPHIDVTPVEPDRPSIKPTEPANDPPQPTCNWQNWSTEKLRVEVNRRLKANEAASDKAGEPLPLDAETFAMMQALMKRPDAPVWQPSKRNNDGGGRRGRRGRR